MKEFTGFDGSYILRTNGYKRNRVTTTIDEFDLVARAVLVNVDDCANVTAIQF